MFKNGTPGYTNLELVFQAAPGMEVGSPPCRLPEDTRNFRLIVALCVGVADFRAADLWLDGQHLAQVMTTAATKAQMWDEQKGGCSSIKLPRKRCSWGIAT